MRNFHLMHQGMDIVPLSNEIIRNGHLWNTETLRTEFEESPHSSVDDIWLRFNDINSLDNEEIIDNHESINYPAFWELPEARKLIFWLMARVNGERLGRCLITRLCPGEKIDLHVDGGDHASYYDRYHIVLQGLPGSVFNCGDESIQMRTGEVWWFNNEIEHEIINNSADDRIHLIVDIRTSR